MVVLHYGSMSGHHAIPLRYFNRTIGVSECMCQLHAFLLKKKMREKKMRKNYEVYRLYLNCTLLDISAYVHDIDRRRHTISLRQDLGHGP